MATRLRWKKQEPIRGLARIGASPRGSDLRDSDGKVYARTSNHNYAGWYWVAGWDSDIPHKNTCGTLLKSEFEAKSQAMEYVRKYV